MLKPEIAKKQLEQWQISDQDDFDAGEKVTRFAKKIGSLPAKLSRIGYGLRDLNEKGARFPEKQHLELAKRRQESIDAFDQLSAKDRIQILQIVFPKMAADVNRTWESLRSAPYSTGWQKKAFRAPKNHKVSLNQRWAWLSEMLKLAEAYQEDQLTPAWLATWAPFIQSGYYGTYEQEIGCLLAAVIDAGGKTGDEVFAILCESGRNEHDIGAMGRHVTQALLLSSKAEGWEFIEKMLLAAQRQEGLRQTILEAIDLTHPDAYRRMLRLIREHDLARFSAVVRAVNVWFGFAWDGVSAKIVNEAIDLALTMLEDPAARVKALKGDEPNPAYFALWAFAFEDAYTAIPHAEKLLSHKRPELRFMGCALLGHLQLTEAAQSLEQCLKDEDLRIVRWALDRSHHSDDDDDEDVPVKNGDSTKRFALLEKLFHRVPEKPKKLEAIVWPWTESLIGQEHLASHLISSIGKLPPTRLLPYLTSFGTWDRRRLIDLFVEQKKWDAESRAAVLAMAGHASSDVRSAAFDALRKLKLTEAELVGLESMLTRKAGDLRRGVLELALDLKDEQALASADRLLVAKDGNQRQAGLELLRQLFERQRHPDDCRKRAEAYRTNRPKLSKDEQTQVSAILDVTPEIQGLTLTNALGLMDPAKRPPVVAPKNHKVKVFTDAAARCLKSLDDLVHKHREEPIVVDSKTGRTELLGTVNWAFPWCVGSKSPEKRAARLPLRDVWETWWKTRPKAEKDIDGLELWRAQQFCKFFGSWQFENAKKWATKPGRSAIFDLLQMKTKPVELKYATVVHRLLDWLTFLHPPKDVFGNLMDICDTLCALVPDADQKLLIPKPKSTKKGKNDSDDEDDDDDKDWRTNQLFTQWIEGPQSSNLEPTDAEFTRLWNLLHWCDQPIPGAAPSRPSWHIIRRAYSLGLANLDEIAIDLIGPRGRGCYSEEGFDTLATLTARRIDQQDQQFLTAHPEIKELVARCRDIILEVELQRGETPTIVTNAANSLGHLEGADTLLRVLSALGKTGFKKSSYYSNRGENRAETLTRLVSITFPAPDESPEQVVAKFKAAVKASAFPEERLTELAFLAPQWAKFIEAYFQWKGMSETLYWFLAHMRSWGSDVEDRAAQGAGLEEEPDEVDSEEDDDDDDDEADETNETPKFEKPPKLSPWERLILERTSLTEQERNDGAIDVAWFRRVHAEIGAARWKQLAQAARFAANASQAKKAQLLADVLLGDAKIDELIKGIKTKYLKENVRLLGLFPLPTNTKRDAELKRRFDVLQEYGRYAKQLSGLTKPEAMRSLEIGLRNLAGTAGYPDPMRLEWALGADALKDLARGPVMAAKEGVVVTLRLDEQAQPHITVARGDKPLKVAPPAVKKDKVVAALFERAKDLKRQVSRQKQSLEAMMCRGESISANELVALCGHALVAPLLERLVFVGDGIMGYPDKKGKALRNFAGKSEAIGKTQQLRIAHPHDLLQSKQWDKWQRDCFEAERIQPFKQIFRELYVVTKQEKVDGEHSQRYAGQQVNPRQGYALWGQRGWNTDEGVFKTFHDEDIIASVSFNYGFTTPLEVEGLTIGSIRFSKRGEYKSLPLVKVPPRLFSEVMRDMDLVVSVAHAGGVDPEATASTVEMRTNLLRETCQLLALKNVKFKASQAVIDGQLAQYSVHLGSGTVHRMPGGSVCIVPVHSQHRGRLFLPFADDDPRTAEVMSKVLLLAKDHEIQDPSILEQLRA